MRNKPFMHEGGNSILWKSSLIEWTAFSYKTSISSVEMQNPHISNGEQDHKNRETLNWGMTYGCKHTARILCYGQV